MQGRGAGVPWRKEASEIMKRTRIFSTGAILALFIAPVALWLGGNALAQTVGRLAGIVYDGLGKPYPGVVLVFKNADTGQTFTVTTDDKGHYNQNGLQPGTINIDIKVKDKVVWQMGVKISAGQTIDNYDINFKDIAAKDAADKAAAEKAREEAAKAFADIKTHFDAGAAALTQFQQVRADMLKTPADQRGPLKDQLTQLSDTAVTEMQAALAGVKEGDANRAVVLARLAEAYDDQSKYEDSAATYQKAIAATPPGANGAPNPSLGGYYMNMANAQARAGKIDDARASYQKAADLDPSTAAQTWRNFGISLENMGKMKEAIEPLQKSTTLDPKNAQGWFLLGSALLNTMTSKQEGEKLIPVLQPGTVEAFQQALALDPNGPIGEQAKQSLEAIQAMGVGIDIKVKVKKK